MIKDRASRLRQERGQEYLRTKFRMPLPEELPVPGAHNVVPLRPRSSPSDALPVSVGRLSAAVRDLDGLRRCIEQIVHCPSWSVAERRAGWGAVMAWPPGAPASRAGPAAVQARPA